MTRIVKKARKIKILNLAFTTFVIMGISFIASSTLLRSYNVSLSATQSKCETRIRELTKEKETLQLEISELSSWNRVTAIVADQELSYNQSNVVTIGENDEKEQ